MIVPKTCTAVVNGDECSMTGVQWWVIGSTIECNCADHIVGGWTNTFDTYEDALAYAAMESL